MDYAERFWSNVDRRGPDECWPWKRSTTKKGYGQTHRNPLAGRRGSRGAHQVAYELGVGPIPEGLHVLHRCDNKICCNYEKHLFLGTNLDNIKDRIAKGRSHHPQVKGIRNPRAVLSDDDVRAIRAARESGEQGTSIAARYGITPGMVGHIVTGRAWRHIDGVTKKRPGHPGLKGTASPRARLSDDDVRAIRLARAGGERCKDIAVEYGVSDALISHIVTRRVWGHVV